MSNAGSGASFPSSFTVSTPEVVNVALVGNLQSAVGGVVAGAVTELSDKVKLPEELVRTSMPQSQQLARGGESMSQGQSLSPSSGTGAPGQSGSMGLA